MQSTQRGCSAVRGCCVSDGWTMEMVDGGWQHHQYLLLLCLSKHSDVAGCHGLFLHVACSFGLDCSLWGKGVLLWYDHGSAQLRSQEDISGTELTRVVGPWFPFRYAHEDDLQMPAEPHAVS